jgi:prepilin-type N-terminal cleavage/methylation domain-containing protein
MYTLRITGARGFTAVEILVVIGVLGVLTASIALSLSSFRNVTALRSTTEDVWLTLRGARNATLSSKDDSVYGVRIESTRAIQFKGTTYVAGATTNVTTTFPTGVVASATFANGANQVTFTRLTGEPSATGTILLTDQRSSATSSIHVLQSGIVDRSL